MTEDNVARSWNEFPDVDDHFKPTVGADRAVCRMEMDGTEPVTDHDSKTVMLQAERRDEIEIVAVVDRFDDDVDIPGKVSVIRRTHTFYGPELMLHAERDGTDCNYLLTAPGPDSHLVLWAAETDEHDRRKGWYVAAEVTAVLSDEGDYSYCPDCGERMETIQHEREAAFGMCPRAESED